MPVLHRDYETRGTLVLSTVGAWKYSRHLETEVLCCAYAIDEGPVKLWTPNDPIPIEFVEAAQNPDFIVSAFNDAFERLIEQHILSPRHGWPIVPLERHRCTQAAALSLALPAALEKAAAALGLECRKDMAGHRGMLIMSRPRKPRKNEDPNGIYWLDDPERLERLYAYCRQDVEVERALHNRVGFLSDEERAVWILDQAINDRGLQIDSDLARAAIRIAGTARERIDAELARLTGEAVTSINQVQKLVAWLGAHDCEVKDLQKGTLHHALTRKNISSEAKRVIELRLDGAHAAANKFEAMVAWANENRVHGAFRFHGASTGRWTSLGVQLQNLKRPLTEDIGAAIEAIATGDYGHLQNLYPQPMSVLGDVARAAIIAAPDCRLIAADFSGIESRVTAWLAGQQSKLAQWAQFDATKNPEDEPYFLLGRTCGLSPEQARDRGKTADLAFGYQGGIGAWKKLAGPEDQSTEDQIQRYREAWRSNNPATCRFWGDINRAAIRAVQSPGKAIRCNTRITFKFENDFLRMKLPSGRKLAHPFPRLFRSPLGELTILYKDSQQGKWTDRHFGQGAYGGLWTENAVSAVARDVFAAAMLRLEAAGYPIVLHVHDEIVAEVPEGFGSQEEFLSVITTLPDWAEGLPVAAKVREGERFCKIKNPAPSEGEQREEAQDQKPHGTFDHIREKACENRRANGQGKNNEWFTPPEILELARTVLTEIDLDPASTEAANQTVKAAKFYSLEEDGLKQEWHGRVWLNPPYSWPEIERFIEKLVAETEAGRVTEALVLVDNKTDTAWFRAANQLAAAICFTERIRFLRPDGGLGFAPTRGQALFYIGPNKQRFAEIFRPLGFVSAAPAETAKRAPDRASRGNSRDGDDYASGEQPWGSNTAEYIYRAEDGEPYLRVTRTSAKQFPQAHWENGRWVWGAPKGPKIPYRLPELIAAPPEAEVWFCEGEKDADNVSALGLVATAHSEGAKARWPGEITKWFVGKKTVYILEDNDKDGRYHAGKVAEALKGAVSEIRIVSFPELPEKGDVSDWLEQGFTKAQLIARAKAGRVPSRDYTLVCMADVQPRSLPWLWECHLPANALEIITGLPDIGKSQVQCQYIACVTTKRPWPDGAPGLREPRNVIILVAEDVLEGMVYPRLLAAGADLARVTLMRNIIRRDGKDQMFLLSEDLEKLERAIVEVGDVGLVTIDPITSYMGGKIDSHRATDVRNQLTPLREMAERLAVGFSILTHPSKNAGPRALDQFLGSQAFIALPRVGHLCTAETEQNEHGQRQPTDRHLFTNPKNNGSPRQPSIAYRIVDATGSGGTDPNTGADIKTSKVLWEEIVSITADEALAAASAKQESFDAQTFLMDILAKEPAPVKYIEERAAGRRGLSDMQLKRAKQKMGIEARKKGMDGGWFWMLPQHVEAWDASEAKIVMRWKMRRGPRRGPSIHILVPFGLVPFGLELSRRGPEIV
jgi:DNA polymerase